MELRTTREMRRNEQLSKAMAKKAESDAPAQAQSARPQAPADKLTLSRQALAFLQEQNQRMWDAGQERKSGQDGRLRGILDAMETEQKKLDTMKEALDALDKCQKIAASIMRGDRVPPEDLQYLMEHDQEGYKMALALRKPKEDPEDVKSVLTDEDKKGGAKEAGGSEEAPGVSAAEPSSGGGEASSTEP